MKTKVLLLIYLIDSYCDSESDEDDMHDYAEDNEPGILILILLMNRRDP